MWRTKTVFDFCLSGLFLVAPLLMAAVIWDETKERAIADKLSQELELGQVTWLSLDERREFPAIFTRAVPEFDGNTAIVLVHGMGGHPDWPEVISPLRQLMAEDGWTTLSVQMPVLPPEAPLAEYGRTLHESDIRLSAAIDYLKNYGYVNVVLAGYGFGAASVADYLVSDVNHKVFAFAGISMLARKYLEPGVDLITCLENLQLPVLDIYGSADLKTIVNSADKRRVAALRNGNGIEYEQKVIWDADHYFTGKDRELYSGIDYWLKKVLQDKKIQTAD